MPATVRFIKDKYRVIEVGSGKIVKNKKGTAVDGGGHTTRQGARRQVQAINSNKQSRT